MSCGSQVLLDQAVQDRFSADPAEAQVRRGVSGSVRIAVGDALADALMRPLLQGCKSDIAAGRFAGPAFACQQVRDRCRAPWLPVLRGDAEVDLGHQLAVGCAGGHGKVGTHPVQRVHDGPLGRC
jgi:hypothetical protein